MSNKVTTISIAPEAIRIGHKAAEKMYGTKKKFSMYIQGLIEKDCKRKKIK